MIKLINYLILVNITDKAMGNYPTYLTPSKIATLVPEFAVEDLPLDRTKTLVPAFAMEDLPLDRTL